MAGDWKIAKLFYSVWISVVVGLQRKISFYDESYLFFPFHGVSVLCVRRPITCTKYPVQLAVTLTHKQIHPPSPPPTSIPPCLSVEVYSLLCVHHNLVTDHK